MGKVVLLLIFTCAVLAVNSFPYPESDRSSTTKESIEDHHPYDLKTYEQTNTHQGRPPVLYTSSNSNPQSGISQKENTNRTVREADNQKPTDQSPLVETKAPSATLGNNNNKDKDVRNQQSIPEILISSEQRTSSPVLSNKEDSLRDRNVSDIQQKNTDESDPLSPSNTQNRRDDSEKTTTGNNSTGEPDDVGIIKLPFPEE